jgi:hypothetical protein
LIASLFSGRSSTFSPGDASPSLLRAAIKRQDAADERSVQGAATPTTPTVSQTNFEQWMSFLSGNNAAVLQRSP